MVVPKNMRILLGMLLLALLTTAPLAFAQEASASNDTRPADAAWTEECPPDMFCAAADEGSPQAAGNGGCIECMGPIDGGETCMDGQDEGEICDPEVYYMGGPTRGPADGSCGSCRGNDGEEAVVTSHDPVLESADTKGRPVPGPAVALGILALAGTALFALRHRR